MEGRKKVRRKGMKKEEKMTCRKRMDWQIRNKEMVEISMKKKD